MVLEQLVFENGDKDVALAIERLINRILLHGSTNQTSRDVPPVVIINLDRVRYQSLDLDPGRQDQNLESF